MGYVVRKDARKRLYESGIARRLVLCAYSHNEKKWLHVSGQSLTSDSSFAWCGNERQWENMKDLVPARILEGLHLVDASLRASKSLPED